MKVTRMISIVLALILALPVCCFANSIDGKLPEVDEGLGYTDKYVEEGDIPVFYVKQEDSGFRIYLTGNNLEVIKEIKGSVSYDDSVISASFYPGSVAADGLLDNNPFFLDPPRTDSFVTWEENYYDQMNTVYDKILDTWYYELSEEEQLKQNAFFYSGFYNFVECDLQLKEGCLMKDVKLDLSLSVKDHNDKPVEYLIFNPIPALNKETSAVSFTDIEAHWGKDAVKKAALAGLFDGYPDGSFMPEKTMNEAELVTVLYKMSKAQHDTVFGEWYATQMAWALENGIAESFDAKSPVTRESFIKMFVKTLEYMGYDIDASETEIAKLKTAADFDKISPENVNAIAYAVSKGIITGTSSTELMISPAKEVNRATVAQMIANFAK